jgi:hypothetical protein
MNLSMVLSRLMKMRHIVLFVAILIGIASLAFGDMYKWVDEKGTVHFTDDYFKIPERYRTEVESREVPKETSPSPAKAKPILAAVSKAPEPKGSEVKLIRKHGVWLADVALNKRVKRQFIVDTGATFTVISRQTANELGIVIDKDTLLIPIETASGFIYPPW